MQQPKKWDRKVPRTLNEAFGEHSYHKLSPGKNTGGLTFLISSLGVVVLVGILYGALFNWGAGIAA